MNLTEPVAIQFHIPATDPLGKEGIIGKLRFLAENVELSWRLKGNVFIGGQGEMHQVIIPYGEIEDVEIVKSWFKIRRLIFRVSDPKLVPNMPGVEMGKMTLEIDAHSRSEAKKLAGLIDFQRSIFRLDKQNRRLDALRAD